MTDETLKTGFLLDAGFFEELTDLRVDQPKLILEEARRRVRRETLTRQGRLVILAADHPGRGVNKAGSDPFAMGNRQSYLSRIVRVLSEPGVDGIMATPDILEELLLLNFLFRKRGRLPFLDRRLMIGSMNRGGVAGTIFEMRDRFGAFTAAHLHKMAFDGAKMMFRLDPESPEAAATVQDCAEALRELEALDLPAFLEPLPVTRSESGYKVIKKADDLIRVIGIASALGNSSRLLWLKIPFVEDYSRVVKSTTCPILMLGGESREDPLGLLTDFAGGLAAGRNVRGVLVGRNILFPGPRDPGKMAAAVAALVHEGGTAPEAARKLD